MDLVLIYALSPKHNMSKSAKCFRRFLSESAKCSALKEIDDSHPPLPSLTASIISSSFLFSVIIGNHKLWKAAGKFSAKCSALKEIDDSHPPLPSLTASIISSSFLFSVIIGNHKLWKAAGKFSFQKRQPAFDRAKSSRTMRLQTIYIAEPQKKCHSL